MRRCGQVSQEFLLLASVVLYPTIKCDRSSFGGDVPTLPQWLPRRPSPQKPVYEAEADARIRHQHDPPQPPPSLALGRSRRRVIPFAEDGVDEDLPHPGPRLAVHVLDSVICDADRHEAASLEQRLTDRDKKRGFTACLRGMRLGDVRGTPRASFERRWGGGGLGRKSLCTKMARPDFPNGKCFFFKMVTLVWGNGGGGGAIPLWFLIILKAAWARPISIDRRAPVGERSPSAPSAARCPAESSLRVLRRVAAFCQPLCPVFRLVSFGRQRGPGVGARGVVLVAAEALRRSLPPTPLRIPVHIHMPRRRFRVREAQSSPPPPRVVQVVRHASPTLLWVRAPCTPSPRVVRGGIARFPRVSCAPPRVACGASRLMRVSCAPPQVACGASRLMRVSRAPPRVACGALRLMRVSCAPPRVAWVVCTPTVLRMDVYIQLAHVSYALASPIRGPRSGCRPAGRAPKGLRGLLRGREGRVYMSLSVHTRGETRAPLCAWTCVRSTVRADVCALDCARAVVRDSFHPRFCRRFLRLPGQPDIPSGGLQRRLTLGRAPLV